MYQLSDIYSSSLYESDGLDTFGSRGYLVGRENAVALSAWSSAALATAACLGRGKLGLSVLTIHRFLCPDSFRIVGLESAHLIDRIPKFVDAWQRFSTYPVRIDIFSNMTNPMLSPGKGEMRKLAPETP